MRKTACLLILVAGCGSQIEQSVGRPTVSEAVSRCRAFRMSDAQIDSFFIAIEADRDRGFTRAEEVEAALTQGCIGPRGNLLGVCSDCALAIIDIVYR